MAETLNVTGLRVLDEGITVVNPAITMDFVGAGVSATNPSPGKATVTISSSGGGYSPLTATETPNGSIKVFTFAAAVAQPTAMVADGATLQPTSKDGSTNWTWNAGAKQATFTIPPDKDVYGVI